MDAKSAGRLVGAFLSATLLVAALTLSGCNSGGTGANSSGDSAVATQTPGGAPPSGPPPSGPPPSGGQPPNGAPGGAPAGGGGPGASTAKYTPAGAYSLSSGSATKSGTISASGKDQSGVLVTKTGSLALTDANIVTTGNSSSSDESSFYGLDAGVLAQNGGKIAMKGGSVKTSGNGANAIFAYGGGTSVTISGTTVSATGQYAHGIMASGGGALTASNLTVNTTGGSSAPIATDRGGGTIVVKGGTYTCSGNNSPAIYSTGRISADGGTFSATGSEVAVIEGSNSIALNNAALTASKAGKWGVMIYQSMSGDAQGAKGVFTQTGGSLTESAASSPLFYVTNTTGVITLKGVKVSTASGILVKAATGQWGTSGSNGGTVNLTADAQALVGNIVADKVSSVSLTLKNGSALKGAVNADSAAKSANLALDGSSSWTLTADSHVTSLVGAKISGSTITNIVGGGHTLTYDKASSANSYLGGKTYKLTGGGTLTAR